MSQNGDNAAERQSQADQVLNRADRHDPERPNREQPTSKTVRPVPPELSESPCRGKMRGDSVPSL